MEKMLQVFESQDFGKIRVIIENGEPWFVAKDVCKCLELSNSRMAVERLDEDEKGVSSIYTPGGVQQVQVVNEAGLYTLILSSRKQEAKNFKRWITHEVLPTIRKTGGYVSNDDMFIETYLPFADENTKNLFKLNLELIRKQNELIKMQRQEIEYKSDVIKGLTENISLADKRQILNRILRKKGTNFHERWQLLYREFEQAYHIDLSRRLENYNLKNNTKLSKIEYVDKVLNMLPQLFEIACKVFESDINSLIEELYRIAI